MAVTPEDARGLLQHERVEVGVQEHEIDDALRNAFAQNGQELVWPTGDLSWRIIQELIRRYEAAGWAVEYLPAKAQRDEPFLSFKPRKETP